MRLVIIGGSDAGISAALRARELDAQAEITVLLADAFPNFSICGLPFYLSGETLDWKDLAHRSEFEGIEILRNHAATAIAPESKTISVLNPAGQTSMLQYDRLVIGTGATPIKPGIHGIDLPGVFLLHTMESSFDLNDHLEKRKPRSAIIVGAGYIGVEMADALTLRGLNVTLVGKAKSVLATVDSDFGELVDAEFLRHGVRVVNATEASSIRREGSQLVVSAASEFQRAADMVLVATGVAPATELAVKAGIPTGIQGAIRVDRSMRTACKDLYAAGDCVETWHRVLDRYTYLPLGTTSHKQGRVAGENAIGGQREFQGSCGTQVVKVFNLAIARTGLLEAEAKDAGFDPFTSEVKVWDHKAYYPGAHEMRIRVNGDRGSGRLLGAQIIGHWQSQVAKRIDIFAAALFSGMNVDELNDLDLSYTPPLSSPWDPVQMAAQFWNAEGAAIRRQSAESPFV
jgi:NADPH-dependent 2,4-dienoyl-CoA reductase/sulfur reductase-like enzyme